MKAASRFPTSFANSQRGVSGEGASGSSEGTQFPTTCIGAEVPSAENLPQRDAVAEPAAAHRASSSTTGIPLSAASTSERKRSGGNHPAVEAPKLRAMQSQDAQPGFAPKTPQDVLALLFIWESDPEADRIMAAATALIDGSKGALRPHCNSNKCGWRVSAHGTVLQITIALEPQVLEKAKEFMSSKQEAQSSTNRIGAGSLLASSGSGDPR